MTTITHRTHVRKEFRSGDYPGTWCVTCDECGYVTLWEHWDAALAIANYHARSLSRRTSQEVPE